MSHRYKLEEYKGPGSRYDCPACHQKRVFARYIDTETGQHISPDVGRCNREDKCGYHYTPSQYFKDHPENRSEYRPDDTGYSHKKSAFSNAIKKMKTSISALIQSRGNTFPNIWGITQISFASCFLSLITILWIVLQYSG